MPNRKATAFNEHCIKAFKNFDHSNVKILTVDQGKEFGGYLDLESTLKVDVYFADPYSSWQRGTNENTNWLIREFFLKKFDFSTITQEDIDIVENILNNRPRKCLGFKTPLEAFNRVGGRQLFCLPTSHTTSTYRSVYGGSLEFNVSFDIFVLD